MTAYVNTYLCSADRQVLAEYVNSFANRVGPVTGRAAVPEQTIDGEVVPAAEAIGNTATYYAYVTAPFQAPLIPGITYADEAIGVALLGTT